MNAHYKIGDWLAEPELNILSMDGKTVHLEPKVMQVLLHLAHHAGQVQTKEQIISAVWADTFVSEQALTRCISVLRRELQDSLHTPRYIQTISKSGYRLVAEVQPIAVTDPGTSAEPERQPLAAASPSATESAPPPARLPRSTRRGILALVGLSSLALVLVAMILFWAWHRKPDASAFRILPLTSYEGQQDQAAFSPNGNSIAFIWTDPETGYRNLYVKQIGSETTLRLTELREWEFSPVWSPDGTQIAYLALERDGLGIFVISSLGGPAKRIYSPHQMIHWEQGALSWSPDGHALIFPDDDTDHQHSLVHSIALDSLQLRVLTAPPANWDGDFDPVYSPDGKRIAFIRASDNSVRDVYVMDADGTNPHPLTHDSRFVDSLSWFPSGDAVLFSSNRGGKFALWKVSLHASDPERLPVGTEDAFQPVINGPAHRLLYTESSAIWSILKIGLQSSGDNSKIRQVVSSTEQDSAPSFAPDGSRFAFQSWRSGSQEIWLSSRDGSSLRQLTSKSKGLSGSPAFSPDGLRVAFDSRINGFSHIFIVPVSGGSQQQTTAGEFNDILPRWSNDGQTLYFASNRNGSWQIWKQPLQGGQPQQVTHGGGFVAAESPDSHTLYFTKGDQPGVWSIPVQGGPETRVLEQPSRGFWGYWCVGKRGIYTLESNAVPLRIVLHEFGSSKALPLATLSHMPPIFAGLTVDNQEEELLMTDEHSVGSHITLVENFR